MEDRHTIMLPGEGAISRINIADLPGDLTKVEVQFRIGGLGIRTAEIDVFRRCPVIDPSAKHSFGLDQLDPNNVPIQQEIQASRGKLQLTNLLTHACGKCPFFKELGLGGTCGGFQVELPRTGQLRQTDIPNNSNE